MAWFEERSATDYPRPCRLPGLAGETRPRARQHRPAPGVAEGVFPLPAVGSGAHRQFGGSAGQPEVMAARAAGAIAATGRGVAGGAGAEGSAVATRSRPAGTVVRHRMPGFGSLAPAVSRRASDRTLLPLSR